MSNVKHSIRYFGVTEQGERVPCDRSMGHKAWRWTATCKPCGWDAGTVGVAHSKIVELVAGHKDVAAAAAPVYCGKCGNTERWATGLPGCPKCPAPAGGPSAADIQVAMDMLQAELSQTLPVILAEPVEVAPNVVVGPLQEGELEGLAAQAAAERTTEEEGLALIEVNEARLVETKNQKLARQARERRAAKKAAKEAIIEATLPVNSFTR
jgi:hypothetical protein